MDYRIEYKPKNKIANPCEFLVEEKVTQLRENARHKTISLLSREHRCLKKNKIVTTYNDCDECDFYKNYAEIIEQQAKRIEELEQMLNK
jgi:hypothetical protein